MRGPLNRGPLKIPMIIGRSHDHSASRVSWAPGARSSAAASEPRARHRTRALPRYGDTFVRVCVQSLPCLSLPFLSLPSLTFPCLALPYLPFPCLTFPCLAWPNLALPCLALPDLILPHLTSSHLTLLTLPYTR